MPRHALAGLCSLSTLQCAGTEADNPFAQPVDVTPCKSHEAYEGLPNTKSASGGLATKGTSSPSTFELSDLATVPVWLECVEWSVVGGELQLQLVNFRGGCEIQWQGEAGLDDDGDVVVELRNESCSVAGCGNCLYDSRASVELSEQRSSEPLSLELVRRDCEGDASSTSEWTLALDQRSRGMACRTSDPWGSGAAFHDAPAEIERELYRPCGDADTGDTFLDDARVATCAGELTCEQERCVPTCSEDADCPLLGGLTCRDGVCQLPQ